MVLDDVRSYAENRMIPSGKDTTVKLADMPFMRDELERITDCLYVYKTFGILNEERFIHSKDGNISKKTVEYIACGKTEIVECELRLQVSVFHDPLFESKIYPNFPWVVCLKQCLKSYTFSFMVFVNYFLHLMWIVRI